MTHSVEFNLSLTFQNASDRTKWTPAFEVRESLTQKKFGERNPDHIRELIKLFEQSNVSPDKFSELEILSKTFSTNRSSNEMVCVPYFEAGLE